MKTSSSGFDARTRARAEASTFRRLGRILPLLSTMRPIDTGTSSRGISDRAAPLRFENVEHALLQGGDKRTALVDHRGVQHHQPRIGAESGRFILGD